MYLWEVGERLASEFKLFSPPAEATIARWFKEAQAAFLADIREFRHQMTFESLNHVDALLRKWLPLATMDKLPINRFAKDKGETVAILDENAIDEQSHAAVIALKAIATRADILGRKDGKAVLGENDKKRTIDDLYAFIGTMAAKQVTGEIVIERPRGTDVLELRSGIEELYTHVSALVSERRPKRRGTS